MPALTPANPDLLPFQVQIRAAYADFFRHVRYAVSHGGAVERADDDARADVVVISPNSMTRSSAAQIPSARPSNLDNHEYRVVGVLGRWEPIPKFYDLNNNTYGKSAEVYLPFTRAIDGQMPSLGQQQLQRPITVEPGWAGRLHSECVWLQFWAELPTAADVEHYRTFLNNYAAEQQRAGRFTWPAHTRIRDVRDWLVYQQAVSEEVRILVLVSFQLSVGLSAQRHGIDAGENHGTSRRHRRAARARRQSPSNLRTVPDRGRRRGSGGRPARTGSGRSGLWVCVRCYPRTSTRLTHFSPSDISHCSDRWPWLPPRSPGCIPPGVLRKFSPAWQLKAQ